MTSTFIAVGVVSNPSKSNRCIAAAGLSAEAAIAEANSYLRPESRVQFEAVECTRRLYDAFRSDGVNYWRYDEAGLADVPSYEKAAAEAAESDEDNDTDGVFEDQDCTVRIDGDDVLPTTFYHRSAGTVTWYEYAGDEQYECRELREDSFGHPFYLQTANDRIGDEVTAEIFLMNNDSRYDALSLADLDVGADKDEDA